MNLIMKSNIINHIVLVLLIISVAGCNTLDVQENFCEVAFAYPIDQPIPENIEKKLIGCACIKKDILKGIEVGQWTLHPLEKCRRIRGFHPKQWKKVIDPFFQFEYQKRSK